MPDAAHSAASPAGEGFWRPLASFAFLSFLKFGRGVVLVRTAAGGEDAVAYIPKAEADHLPENVLKMVDTYDPARGAVVILQDGKARTAVLQLTARRLGTSPIDLYRARLAAEGRGRFVPGNCCSSSRRPAMCPPVTMSTLRPRARGSGSASRAGTATGGSAGRTKCLSSTTTTANSLSLSAST